MQLSEICTERANVLAAAELDDWYDVSVRPVTANVSVAVQLLLLPRAMLNNSIGVLCREYVAAAPVQPAPVAVDMVMRTKASVPLLLEMVTGHRPPLPGHVATIVQLGVDAEVPVAYTALVGAGMMFALLTDGVSVND